MECAFDAQNLISISLRKIHNSRTQRGGIKLYNNLLVTYVLRNARQFYMSEEFTELYKMKQYGEIRTVSGEKQDPLEWNGNCEDLADEFCCNYSEGESDTYHCAAPLVAINPAGVAVAHTQDAPACSMAAMHHSGDSYYKDSEVYWSCCADPDASTCDFPSSNTLHNQKTVLDLDTHMVTTVENGYLHQDCCASLRQYGQCAPSLTKKRKVDSSYYVSDSDYLSDCVPSPCKRTRSDDVSCFNSDRMDTNISNLISVLGSGFTELLNWQTDLGQIFNGQTNCCKALADSGSWTRAIEAF